MHWRAVLLLPHFVDRYVNQFTCGVFKRCRYRAVLHNGAAYPFAVLGNGAVFAALELHRFQACAVRWIFRHNKPCTDRDFVNHNLAVVRTIVFFHLTGVLLRLDYIAEALPADIAELDGKGKFLTFQFLVRGGDLAYDQLAGLDLVGENHLQLGQLVRVSLVAVRAKNQRVGVRRLLGRCVRVYGVVSVKVFINHLFRSVIVRGGAIDVLQRVNTARLNNVLVAFYLCNGYAVFVYRPACVVQFGVG